MNFIYFGLSIILVYFVHLILKNKHEIEVFIFEFFCFFSDPAPAGSEYYQSFRDLYGYEVEINDKYRPGKVEARVINKNVCMSAETVYKKIFILYGVC